MKKCIARILLCGLVVCLLTGCENSKVEQEKASQVVQMGNPWSEWSTIKEAEEKVGFEFGLPEVVADKYTADKIRTMNGELMEIIYRYEELEIRVRKKMGEGQDISGDYNEYEFSNENAYNDGTVVSYHNSNNSAVKQIISYQGYSWSIVAFNGYGEDYNEDFIKEIFE